MDMWRAQEFQHAVGPFVTLASTIYLMHEGFDLTIPVVLFANELVGALKHLIHMQMALWVP